MIKIFTIDCHRCKILEMKLKEKGIAFEICTDMQEVIDKGYRTAPILKIGEEYKEFGQAIIFIKEYDNEK